MFLSCVSDLCSEVGRIGALPLGKKPLSIPPLELFTCEHALLCHLSPLCRLTKYTAVGTALSSTLTMSMPAIGPGDSQALFSLGYQCRSTEVTSQDCSRCAPGPAVGAMEAAQSLVWPNPHVYVPTKPIAAKARPVTLVVYLDVSQVLNLRSRQRRCKSMVHTAVRRHFSSSSLVT